MPIFFLSHALLIFFFFGELKYESESERCSVVSDSLQPYGLCSAWNSAGQNTGVVGTSPTANQPEGAVPQKNKEK